MLFVPIAAGSAHVSSAQAMAGAIEVSYPGRYDLRVRELMPSLGFEALDRRHKEAWRAALKRPWTVRLGQALSDSLPQFSIRLQRRLLDDFARQTAEALRKHRPSLIVATHGWISTAMALAKRRYGLDVPVITFVTLTVDATAIWADPWAERYIIGAQRGKRVLSQLGVPEDKIDVIGYPVRQAFLSALSKPEARRALRLKERFTCLIVLGGEGVGNVPHALIAWLRDLTLPLQIVVITGRNEALKRELETLALDHVQVTGFVDNMETYMAASDVIIGKVSGATVFEALAVGRPILATAKSYRSEDEYIRYLSAKDLGSFCPDRASLQASIRHFYQHPRALEAVANKAHGLDFPAMRSRIAEYLVSYAETGKPALDLTGCGIGWT